MLIAGSSLREISNFKARLSATEADLWDEARDRSAGTLNLSQELYIEKQSPNTVEERDHMTLVPYASTIGSFMYAMVCTRHYMAHAVGVVSRNMANPGKEHWEDVKWLLRYLRGTSITSLCLAKAMRLYRVLWRLIMVGMITRERVYPAEYVAIVEDGKEMIWLADYLEELG
uniref:Reverse transcriptase Ty1/copia-type domain-containing protein n=1 Tax=Solanum lycopersicum TaxID=4081 RepID=A0A3Q7IH70_SOLLC